MTTAQLATLGIGRAAVAHRVRTGRLQRLHRGVYLVAPAPFARTPESAALLAAGTGSVLSHATAAAIWGFPANGASDRLLHVTVARRAPASRIGVRIHRVRRLDRRERTVLDGLAVTTAPRTLLDVAATLPPRDVERALEHAEIHRLVSSELLDDVVRRHRGHRGCGRLRAAMAALDEPRLTRSEAERRLLDLVRAARLPSPEANTRVAGHEVDFLWRGPRLVVEVDGYAFHGGRAAFERDRRRDADLLAAGQRVLRVTWRQIAAEPEALVAWLATALAAAR